MWKEDDAPPQRANALPSSVRRAHTAARRPKIAHVFTALSSLCGGFAALFITIALTSGMCLGDASDCGAVGEATLLFGIFTVPIGVALGAVIGGAQVDRAARAYRPEM